MELTTKGRYAVMALADLAQQRDDVAVPLSQIAERQSLPLAYLEQIFVPLRRAGLVDSARGRAGGYRLAHPAHAITVAAVMAAVDEETRFTRCSDAAPQCQRDAPCLTHKLWSALGDVTSEFMARITLADVASGVDLKQAGTHAPSASAMSTPATSARAGREARPRIYLDYNATAPLRPEAKAAMIAALDVSGNPSSVHAEGRAARGLVETAREQVAKLVGAKPSEVVFTSGASEANGWALAQAWDEIIVSAIEHESILASARASGARITVLPVAGDGVVRLEALADHVLLAPGLGRTALALQWVNNETGVIQPVAEAAAFAREHGIHVHCDAVQAPGRIGLDFAALGVDTLALSAHKLGGPKGIGALVIRDRLDLAPLLRGGGQERRRRAGTENVAAIAGFGAAAEAAMADSADVARLAQLRDELEAGVSAVSPRTVRVIANVPRIANTTLLALPGKLSETLVIRLDLMGFAVSAGSACSSGKVGASHVLTAMGVTHDIAAGAIRLSLGPATTRDDVAAFIAAWKTIADQAALAA